MVAKKTQPAPTTKIVDTNAVLNRLSQQFNLLAVLIVALFLFQGYTFYRVKNIQTTGPAAGAGQQGGGESPLSETNLIAYAKEIDLDTKKFEQCLSKGEKAEAVGAEVAEATGLGVQGTPGFFINGKFLGGAFPFENFKEIIDKELDGTSSTICTDYSEGLQTYCSDPANPSFKPEPVAVNVGNSPFTGPKDAPVTILEYSDFECPFCARAFGTIQQLKAAYPKEVKIVFKQLPLTQIHPNAQKAAEASLCAQDQGKFWEMHDKLFQVQGA
ncbi:MAG: thioredoxin domain-containing protein [bacterium]|nr:thioredoxin domain-containing protein [bacterium]